VPPSIPVSEVAIWVKNENELILVEERKYRDRGNFYTNYHLQDGAKIENDFMLAKAN